MAFNVIHNPIAFSSGNLALLNVTTMNAATLSLTNALGTGYGGTGLTSFTANQIHYGSFSQSANLTFDGTTLTASNISTGGSVTLSGGTAKGVAYLNGSEVLTTGSALTFDGSTFTVTRASAYNTRFAYDAPATYYTDIGYGGTNTVAPSNPFYYFSLNGSEQMRLTSTGLGIGTSSPDLLLTVGSSGKRGTAHIVGTSSGTPVIQLDNTNASGGHNWGLYAGSTSAATFDVVDLTVGATRLTVDGSGNLGLGVTPSAWATGYKAIQNLSTSWFSTTSRDLNLGANVYVDSGGYKYIASAAASLYTQYLGVHSWYYAGSGTAANTVSFTQAMTLDNSGRFMVGTTTPLGSAGTFYGGSATVILSQGSSSGYAGLRIYNDINSSTRSLEIDYYGSAVSGGERAEISTTGAYPLCFLTTNIERARIDANGNFLIGGTSQVAGEKFLVKQSSGTMSITFNAANTGTPGVGIKMIGSTSNTNWMVGANYNYAGGFEITPSTTSGGNTFSTAAFYISSTGQVGIGTTSPSYIIDANANTATNIIGVNLRASTAGDVGKFMVHYGSTEIMSMGGSWSGSAFSSFINAPYAPLVFNINGSEAARIVSSGALYIGTTTDPAGYGGRLSASSGGHCSYFETTASSGYACLTLKRAGATSGDQQYFITTSGLAGIIASSGTSTTYGTSSDYRLKENVQPMVGALDTIAKLKPVTYKWKHDGSDGQGFVAHELQEIFPDAVIGEKDAVDENGGIKPQNIDTSYLVATLTAAIQELKAEFDAYKASHP